MKQTVRLTESDMHRIVRESVKSMLNEGGFWDNIKGAVQGAKAGYNAQQSLQTADTKQHSNDIGIKNNGTVSKCLKYLLQFTQNAVNEWNKGGRQNAKDVNANLGNVQKYADYIIRLLDNSREEFGNN